MNRLSIIDLPGGMQPIHGPDQQVSIVFNGEIYNYRELRQSLESDYPFVTRSDTEVILAGYYRWGEAVFEKLNGMFAIALYDRRSRRVLLARDPFGIKPLFLYVTGDRVVFGSELKIFTQHAIARTVSLPAVWGFLTSGYTFHPGSALDGVNCLEPGQLAAVGVDLQVEMRRFCDQRHTPVARQLAMDPSGAQKRVLASLEAAVVRQMVSDVPVGLLLSAGLDSMLILAALRRAGLAGSLQTFTVSFDEPTFSECGVVRSVAETWSFRNEQHLVQADDVVRHLDDLCYCFDNLELLPTAVAIYFVSQLAGSRMRVVLAGNGGDELFGGYPTYQATLLARRMRLLSRAAPALRRLFVRTGMANGESYLSRGERMHRFLEGAVLPEEQAHLYWRHVFVFEELSDLLRDDYRPKSLESVLCPQLRHFDDAERSGLRDVDKLIEGDLHTWLVDCGLSMWDKAGMSASLEIRVPFLDCEFVRHALGIPGELRADPPGSKRFLRTAAQAVLPDQIRRMPKHGFQVPLAAWMRQGLHQPLQEGAASLPPHIFDPRVIENYWRRFHAGETRLALRLWTLGTLGRWATAHQISWP